jgi:hypothetical protein
VVTGTLARYLDIQPLGSGSSRIDLTGSYESVSDDPARKDRGVLSLTYSNRLLDSLGAAIGISYANHAEFLPKSDHELSAHFGISYRMFPQDPKQIGK